MPATSARTVPCMALASAFAALKVSVSPFCSIETSSPKRLLREPSGPFTEISPPASVTSTLGGSLTGLFPMRDMISSPSGDDADDFAAHAGRARLAIGHHAARSRDDRDPEAVHHPRYLVLVLVDAKPGLRYALDLLDDRTSRVILERDLELRAGLLARHAEVLDIAFVLQHLGDRHLHAR